MNQQPQVLYVADAYRGWCFGFGPRLQAFEAANRERIAFRVISGGLFVGDRARAIREYPHIPDASARIERLNGVQFGPAYKALSETDTYIQIATEAGLGPARVEAMLVSGEAARVAASDFAEARDLGVTAYPTVLLINEGRVNRLAAAGTTLEAMNHALENGLSKP